jgi:DNA modification methylase
VDLVVTSPPYWRKRDYGTAGQIGQERTPEDYVRALVDALKEWWRLLRPSGSLFLNIGDTYHERSIAGIPARIATAAAENGWLLRNQIVWAKDRGMPAPVKDRLASRHEYVFHLAKGRRYYYDLFGYSQRFGNGANPGDVWHISPMRNMSEHLAPFPDEIAERAIILACPEQVCERCGSPRRRIVRRTTQLDPSRPQAPGDGDRPRGWVDG